MVRDEDPATFACICATLLPKQLEIEDTPGEAALSNEQIEEYYAFLSERMQARRAKPHGKHDGGAQRLRTGRLTLCKSRRGRRSEKVRLSYGPRRTSRPRRAPNIPFMGSTHPLVRSGV